MDVSSITQAGYIQPSQTQQPEKEVQPSSKEVEVTLARRQSKAEDWEPYTKLMGDSQLGMITHSFNMREAYTGVQYDLMNDAPDLIEKDWDFSVDGNGEIVIIEGKDKLSESDVKRLTDILEDNHIDDHMNKLAESVINWGVGRRGPEGFAEEGLGRYDVNKENFKDIVFGREIMTGMKINPDTAITKADTYHYGVKRLGYGYSEKELRGAATKAYNQNKQTASEIIVAQIQMRAKPTLD